jgi:aromatic ring-cleaving dioxygenase
MDSGRPRGDPKKVTAKIVSRQTGSAHVFFSSEFFSASKKPRSKLLEKFFSILGGAFSPKVRPFLHEKVPRKIA